MPLDLGVSDRTLGLDAREQGGGIFRQQHRLAQLEPAGLDHFQRQQRRLHAPDPLQLGAPQTKLALARLHLAERLLGGTHGVGLVLPVLRPGGGGLELAAGRLEGIQRLVVGPLLRAGLGPLAARLLFQRLQHLAELVDARGRLEQHAPEIVRRLEDAGAARNQRGMVQRIHLLEEQPVRAAQPGIQRLLSQGGIGRAAQRLPVALAALEGELLATMLQHRAQAHQRLVVQEIQRGARMDAEQQIADGRPGGRLAGLVGTDDQVDVLLRLRQLK